MLGGNDGLSLASIAAMVESTEHTTEQHLLDGANRGIFSRIDGRWIAWPICPTCGYGANDRHHAADHPAPGVCETHPVDYCAGYPLTDRIGA